MYAGARLYKQQSRRFYTTALPFPYGASLRQLRRASLGIRTGVQARSGFVPHWGHPDPTKKGYNFARSLFYWLTAGVAP